MGITKQTARVGLVTAGLLVACGGEGGRRGDQADGGADAQVDASDDSGSGQSCDVPGLFRQRCGSSACHEGETAQAGLDLVTAGLESRLSGAPAVCGGDVADPADPDGSMLFKKVAMVPSCGSVMPVGGERLSDHEVQCVRAWISGLLPPEPPMSVDPKDDKEDEEEPPPEIPEEETCTPGEERPCFSGPDDTKGVGVCVGGTQRCMDDMRWGACEGENVGVGEDCTTPEDDDCDPNTPAQGCTDTWSRSYGIAGSSQNGRSVAVDSAGNVYLLGDFEVAANLGVGIMEAPGGKANIFLIKLDRFGNVLWVKNYGDTSSQFGQQLLVDRDDNVILLNRAYGTVDYGGGVLDGPGETDIHVVKLGPDGEHLWSSVFGGRGADRAEDLAVDAQGNVYVTGTFTGEAAFGGRTLRSARYDQEPPDRDVFVLKLDGASGAELYAARFGGPGDDYGRGIALDAAGDVYLAGYFGGSVTDLGDSTIGFGGAPLLGTGNRDIFVARLDARLAHVWSKGFGSEGLDEVTDLALAPDGDLVMTGVVSGDIDFGGGTVSAGGSRDLLLLRLAADGSHVLSRIYGDAGDQQELEFGNAHAWNALALDTAGNIYLGGFLSGSAGFGATPIANLTSAGKTDAFVVKLTPDATFVWGRRFGKAGTEVGLDVAVSADGFVLLAGRTFGTSIDFGTSGVVRGRGSADVFLAKLAPDE